MVGFLMRKELERSCACDGVYVQEKHFQDRNRSPRRWGGATLSTVWPTAADRKTPRLAEAGKSMESVKARRVIRVCVDQPTRLANPLIGAVHWSEQMRRRNELALLPKLPLLITESAGEFDALRDAFEQEIKPRGIIEQMYVHDISAIVWEILRMRRCKVVIINSAFRSALQDLLVQLLKQPGQQDFHVKDKAQTLAQGWFTDKEAHKQVLETLSRFELDETAIEAEAIRKSSADLELLDRMLTSLESRRDKALGRVAEYRASLAHQLRQSADRIIDGKGILRLEDASSNSSTAA